MKKLFSFFLCLFYLLGQNKPLVKYTVSTGIYDTLSLVSFDTSLIQGKTNFNFGIDTLIEILPQTAPTQNIFQNTLFTRKRKASLDFDLNKYPIRTAIKLFNEDDDTLADNCSGIMISKKHVLTAAHCFLNFVTDSINNDSILACPVYDNGNFNTRFNCSYVNHIYYFDDWNFGGEDIAVLELNDSIGLKTGWVGIGFDKVDSSILNGTFFKFSYPSITLTRIDTNSYNGDTIYYNYGIADLANQLNIGIYNTKWYPRRKWKFPLKN
ncbi:MAG: trypsin-like serine protease [Flavobacteriales bacterium]|nr:trypsin-like serine protease [Flavobacteriales bacterium]